MLHSRKAVHQRRRRDAQWFLCEPLSSSYNGERKERMRDHLKTGYSKKEEEGEENKMLWFEGIGEAKAKKKKK